MRNRTRIAVNNKAYSVFLNHLSMTFLHTRIWIKQEMQAKPCFSREKKTHFLSLPQLLTARDSNRNLEIKLKTVNRVTTATCYTESLLLSPFPERHAINCGFYF